MLNKAQIDELNAQFASMATKDILAEATRIVGRLALAFSGAEDVLLLHYGCKLQEPPQCFALNTLRLHRETVAYIKHIEQHYDVQITLLEPDKNELEEFIKNKGLYSFYKDGHEECCEIRKVAPLRRHLQHFDAWITGQRQDQSPTRQEIPHIEVDTSFSTPEHQVLKINPLANVTAVEVWQQIRMLEIPYNPLHDRGYTSIGCEPCTKPIGPGQHEREGRWWWEEATIKECGLHRGNLNQSD